jgi:hypothetical protein
VTRRSLGQPISGFEKASIEVELRNEKFCIVGESPGHPDSLPAKIAHPEDCHAPTDDTPPAAHAASRCTDLRRKAPASAAPGFLSDRKSPVTLFVSDPATKEVSQLLENRGLDIKSAWANPGAIV